MRYPLSKAAASSPTATEQTELTHTAGRISKGLSAPRPARKRGNGGRQQLHRGGVHDDQAAHFISGAFRRWARSVCIPAYSRRPSALLRCRAPEGLP